ncbi:hypothetical protein M407DRAFT_28058 [Tulasnella calospora MUT 4182]|uniref:F-box domain-containing protein n=1 Tax=Tulasnella calospora MUT 4182 TaxID=1051891 RepID=A0A0C3QBE8_9AGAM|nr:hypothetical protein M407DRAFT_28058 [Tulasnella calospora MUT 4182]
MHPVLSTPELLLDIFQWVPVDQMLAVALVNQTWSEWALDLKWRTAWVPLKALVSILGSLDTITLNKHLLYTLGPVIPSALARFYHRSRAVTRLTFQNRFGLEPSSLERIEELSRRQGPIFSDRLAQVYILLEEHTKDTAHLLLAPSLRDVEIRFGWPRPPPTTAISFTNSLISVAAEHLYSITTVVEWPKDTDLTGGGAGSYVASPLWETLTAAPGLRHLYLIGYPVNNFGSLPAKRFSPNHTFSSISLENLTLVGIGRSIPTSLALSIAATHMPNLLRLETPETCLGTQDAVIILQHLKSTALQLEVLTLCLEQDLEDSILRDCLSFRNLRNLSLTCKGNNNLTETEWSRIMRSSPALPTLQTFSLKQSSRNSWEVPLTVSSLFALASRAPDLESLTLPLNANKFGSTVFLSRPRSFYSLRHLSLVVYIPESACNQFAHLIASMCPNAQELHVVGVTWNGQIMKGLTQMVLNHMSAQHVSTGSSA